MRLVCSIVQNTLLTAESYQIIARLAPGWYPNVSGCTAYVMSAPDSNSNSESTGSEDTLPKTECLLQIDTVYNVTTIYPRAVKPETPTELSKVLSEAVDLVLQRAILNTQETFSYTLANEISFAYGVYIPSKYETETAGISTKWPGQWRKTTNSAKLTIVNQYLPEYCIEYYTRLTFDRHYSVIKTELSVVSNNSNNNNSSYPSIFTSAPGSNASNAITPSNNINNNITSSQSSGVTTANPSTFGFGAPLKFNGFGTASFATPSTSTSSNNSSTFNVWAP